MLNPQLQGKACLITGAASGIGRAIALALARQGVSTALVDRNDTSTVAAEVAELGATAMPIVADLSNHEEVDSAVEAALGRFPSLELFVNNAAIAMHSPIELMDTQSWRTTIDTNLSACVWASRRIARHMRERRQGSILIIGSTSVFTPAVTEAAYRASKAGLKAIMEVLAIELAPFGIRVNMLTPGSFRTGLSAAIPSVQLAAVEREIPLSRSADPDELTSTATLLLSDALSPYTTGANFLVDGGLHLRPLRVE